MAAATASRSPDRAMRSSRRRIGPSARPLERGRERREGHKLGAWVGRDGVRVLGTNAKALRGQPSARFQQESDRAAPNYPRGRLTLTLCPGYDTSPLQARLRMRYETWSRLSAAAALRLQRRPTSSGTVRSLAR